MFVAAAAIAGLLAMHGFDAALVHAGHAGPGGHVRTSAPSPAESHVLSGSCTLDEPSPAPSAMPPTCVVGSLLAHGVDEVFESSIVPRLANRAILTAFSVLRL